jgi:hypothetical protein
MGLCDVFLSISTITADKISANDTFPKGIPFWGLCFENHTAEEL